MVIFLNGRFVSEDQALVSLFDRGFLYGDGLFETLPVWTRVPFRLEQHLDRLFEGAEFLNLEPPCPRPALRQFAARLIELNGLSDATLRIALSRGVGARGYSPRGAREPTLAMTLHPAAPRDPAHPPLWRLATASVRMASFGRLSRFKTCNKLPQILARAEAEARGADEALLLNGDGLATEASSANVFWISGGTVCTPPLEAGIVAGVTRAAVLEVCRQLRLAVREELLPPQRLPEQDGVFLTLSTLGIVEAVALEGQPLRRCGPTACIRDAYWASVRAETRAPQGR